MKKLVLLLVLVLVASVAVPGYVSPPKVSAGIVIQDSAILSYSCGEQIYGTNAVSQSFVSGAINWYDTSIHWGYSSSGRYTMDSIDLWLGRYGTVDNATHIDVTIHRDNGSGNPGSPFIWGQGHVGDIGNSVNNAGYTTFSMSGGNNDIGCRYHIVVQMFSGDGSNYIYLQGSIWNAYKLGSVMLSTDNGSTWTPETSVGYDMAFATYGEELSTTKVTGLAVATSSYIDNDTASLYLDYDSHYYTDAYEADDGTFSGLRPQGMEWSWGKTIAYELGSDNSFPDPYFDSYWRYGVDTSLTFTSLDPHTVYYVTVRLGTPYDLDWTGGIPAFIWSDNLTFSFETGEVITNPATDISSTSAMLNGHIHSSSFDSVLYETTGRGFQWNDTGGFSDPWFAGMDTWTEEGSWVGDYSVSHTITEYGGNPLVSGTTYYFRAISRGPMVGEGTYAWMLGNVEEFTLLEGISGLTIVGQTTTTIDLEWNKGTWGTKTLVMYDEGDYPATYLDGTQGYFGTDDYCTIIGLNPGTTYYFRAWSWAD